VIEGKYKLTVLLRNTAGKEFSLLERDVEVPSSSGGPRLSVPVLGYTFSDARAGVHVPYQAADKKINIDPKNLFSTAEEIALFANVLGLTPELWKGGSVGIFIKGAKPDKPYQKSLSFPLNAQAFHPVLNITQSLATADFLPDYYDLTLTLKDSQGKALDERRANFIVSPVKALPHPVATSKATPLSGLFMFFNMLADQYDKMDENEKAEAAYKKALALNPDFKQRVPEYAGFLLKVKKFDEALQILETVKGDDKLKFPYFLLKGKAQMGLGKYAEAIVSLSEGNKVYNSDASLLSALGFCFYKTGRIQNALDTLNASLKLNPNQDDVKKLIQTLAPKK